MNKCLSRIFLIISVISFSHISIAQHVTVSGFVANEFKEPMMGASVVFPDKNKGTITDNNGHYKINVDIKSPTVIQCKFLGYKTVSDTIYPSDSKSHVLNFVLYESSSQLESVTVHGVQQRDNSLTRISIKSINQLPTTSGNFEDMLKVQSGVVSGNELSSQYSVRGGSFDENLIYVNDIEIYRPFLVQSATQEGLSFINSSMVSSVQFSAGGFNAEYGDKMASVLDVKYKKPTSFEGGFYSSLLGAGLHFAGTDKSNKVSYNTGIRYKTTSYLLNSLDVEGEYVPRFTDIQTLLSYDLSPNSSISFLGNYSSNSYYLKPENRDTDFGTISETLNFKVYYEGEENDRFDSYMGALSYNYKPNDNLILKVIGSAFDTDEEINYDILSEYWINQVSTGSTDTVINIGTGASLEHARNSLHANVFSLEHRGLYTKGNASWKWGVRVQNEIIDDVLSEWRMIDSAGFSIPYDADEIELDYSYKAQNQLNTFRYSTFIQNTSHFYGENANYSLTVGLRANYWNLNKELLLSPRAAINIKPYWDRQVQFYFATGVYNQPPFYKEIKRYDGELYPDTKAQKSLHFIFGTDYYFQAWNRTFIFTSEIYYKHYSRLIPYKVDNISLTYMPQYHAVGYAQGIDLRVNGEFVEGLESWFNLSLLQTRENTYNDYYINSSGKVIYPGYYRRPTDQTLTMSIFFQDYLPSNPNYKLHLIVNYGTGLPYSGPNNDIPSETYQLNQYRRVDIGFSRFIERQKNKQIGLHDIWITFEILNLIDAPNMASYDWIKTVQNNDGYQSNFAVPNYLTGRRFNLKISAKL